MAKILKGSVVADAIIARAREKAAYLATRGITPTLALVRVGDRADDAAYERGARKRAEAAGVAVRTADFPQDVTQDALLTAIRALNADETVHGILVFRPLPAHLDEPAICAAISPAKDVDAATPTSLASVYLGGAGFAPCTAQAVVEILDTFAIAYAGKRVCVVGRSQVVGKPAAALLLNGNATVTTAHSRSEDLPAIMRAADIVVTAVGRPAQFGADCFAAHQTVIDVGINWDATQQKLVGDVAFAEVEPKVCAITPVPGGVGSVTSAVLIEHVVEAAAKV